jgi:two-component system nitrate/nitrite response regulator NarL
MKGSRRLSVVIADDHPVVLHGVADLLRSHADMNVVSVCSDGAAAMDAIQKFAPDVALLDFAMPGKSGLEVLSNMTATRSTTKVIFLTATATDSQLITAVACGARGIMLKDTALNDLVDCVRAVAAGGHWLPPDLLDAALRRETGRQLARELIDGVLTQREREVMRLVAEGLSNKDVGRRLNLSEGTVKIHLHNIYKKLDVPNRTVLTAVAIAHRDQFES